MTRKELIVKVKLSIKAAAAEQRTARIAARTLSGPAKSAALQARWWPGQKLRGMHLAYCILKGQDPSRCETPNSGNRYMVIQEAIDFLVRLGVARPQKGCHYGEVTNWDQAEVRFDPESLKAYHNAFRAHQSVAGLDPIQVQSHD